MPFRQAISLFPTSNSTRPPEPSRRQGYARQASALQSLPRWNTSGDEGPRVRDVGRQGCLFDTARDEAHEKERRIAACGTNPGANFVVNLVVSFVALMNESETRLRLSITHPGLRPPLPRGELRLTVGSYNSPLLGGVAEGRGGYSLH